jgi:hypothetical protein
MATIAYIVRMDRPSVLTVKKLVAMAPEMAQAIEDFRFANRVASESEAIRRLIEAGLQAAKTPSKRPSNA